MRKNRKILNRILGAVLIAVFCLLVVYVENGITYYSKRILLLGGIYLVLSMGLNIIYGFTGMFSLGQYGFMAIGAYVTALCYLSPSAKEGQFVLQGIVPWIRDIHMGFLPALIMGGLVSLVIGWLLGQLLLFAFDILAARRLAQSAVQVFQVIRFQLLHLHVSDIRNDQILNGGQVGLIGLGRPLVFAALFGQPVHQELTDCYR